ncbi:hypothetical protein SDRG_10260 [Saprolegnia diclina VS20]|uniref:Uncharacterized protein n=1 Tax=Saprolegnia diclina (strain VS20) TaxID=1156394 RepID=T0RIC0_SAPDV|nr:hypothetical protein SDRG_10260 [Saprolegnia diclina VS20]EQC32063.1 hypothetical protein SDRG_10260 [Saprolegnia diclina VS20]|eukprot:XP_008614465.1 hypothetical protein SDRG_10260 [Saprolegnia diclina VS20]
MAETTTTTACGCAFANGTWQHVDACAWTHCRMCAWCDPHEMASDAGFSAFTAHFAVCAGRRHAAHLDNWLVGPLAFGATVEEVSALLPEYRGVYHERRCPVAPEVTNFHCIYFWVPLAEVAHHFRFLPRTLQQGDYACFLFEKGCGLRMISLRFFEPSTPTDIPTALAYFARLFQVQLDEHLDAAFLTPDATTLISLGPRGYHADENPNVLLTVLEFADAHRPPVNNRNYLPLPPTHAVLERWLPLPLGTSLEAAQRLLDWPATMSPDGHTTLRGPLAAVATRFPCLPPGLNANDEVLFVFEPGTGLVLTSLRFFEEPTASGSIPRILAYLSGLVQLPLNMDGDGIARVDNHVLSLSATMLDRPTTLLEVFDAHSVTAAMRDVVPTEPGKHRRHKKCAIS